MKTKNMKIKRNIILGAMIPIMFFSVAKIANADVYHVGFSNNTGSVTMTLTVEYALDKLTYSPGENITPRIETADRGDIRCANGVAHAQNLYGYKYNFEIGSPNLNQTIQHNQISQAPDLSMDAARTTIYYKNTTIFSVDEIPHNIEGYRATKISSAVIFDDNSIKVSVLYENSLYEEDYVIPSSYTSIIPDTNTYFGIIESYIPFSISVSTNMRPVLGGTYVYGSDLVPYSIKIPNNASAGKYVAQLKYRPSYTVYTPAYGAIKGSWNQDPENPNTGFSVCPDGSIPTDGLCPLFRLKTCSDGTKVLIGQLCPEEPQLTKTCWNGTVIPITQTCPTETQTCWDGSVIPITQTCPAYKTCPDGTKIDPDALCPRVLLPEIQIDDGDGIIPLSFSDRLFGVKKALASIESPKIEAFEILLDDPYGGGGTPSPTPPATCGKDWWCGIIFYDVPFSQDFEIISIPPAVQVK